MTIKSSTIAIREVTTHYLPAGKSRLANFSSCDNVADYWGHLQYETAERFIVCHLNTKNDLVAFDTVSIGHLNGAIVHPREVFKSAILNNAASVVLIHNHPSGDPTPSGEDISLTERLKKVGELVGIEVLDHVIIGDNRYNSLKQLNYV